MMTPVADVYVKLTYASIGSLGVALIAYAVAGLKEHHWNIITTIKDFLRDF